jgi:competence protein ComEC
MIVGLLAGFIFGVAMRALNNDFLFDVSPWLLVAVLISFVILLPFSRCVYILFAILAGLVLAIFRCNTVDFSVNAKELDNLEFMTDFQADFANKIRQNIPEEESKLGLSYLLGMKSGLSKEMSELLRIVGMSHIVVASGTHLSILIGVCRKIFGKISRFAGLLFSLIFIFLFGSMISWTPSILRAAIVSFLSISAWYVGRKWQAWRIILFAMAITLMIEPRFFLNIGWELSFGAYAGIMLLTPRIKQFLFKTDKINFISETLIASIAATIMCLPITLYYFGTFSLLSFPANLIILPTMPMVMGMTFLTGAFSFLPVVGMIFGKVSCLMLDFHILVVKWLGEKTYLLSSIPINQPWVWLIYLAIFGLIALSWALEKRKTISCGGSFSCVSQSRR